jgi:hypothetical protein
MTALLGTKAAATYLGVATQTLSNWRWANQGPRYTRVGRLIKYRQADLDAYLARNDSRPAA